MTEFSAILYTSKNGHTKRYAEMLGQMTGKPVFPADKVPASLSEGSPVIYMGWIHASNIKGYKQAAKRFSVPVVCGVGLCDTGTQTDEVRKVTSIPDSTALFTLQGGLDRSRLNGMDKLLISMLIKGLGSKKQRSGQDDRMLELLKSDADHVSEDNMRELRAFLDI